MTKTRKTRKQKVASRLKREQGDGFSIKNEWLTLNNKRAEMVAELSTQGSKYLKLDLTKTFFLTMLVLALELALWRYLGQ